MDSEFKEGLIEKNLPIQKEAEDSQQLKEQNKPEELLQNNHNQQIPLNIQQNPVIQQGRHAALRQDVKESLERTDNLIKSQQTERILSEWEDLDIKQYIKQQNMQLNQTLKSHHDQVRIEGSKKRLIKYHAKFKSYRISICKDPILNPEKKIKALQRLLIPYKDEIATCLQNRNSLPADLNREMDLLSNLLQVNEPEAIQDMELQLGLANGYRTRDLQREAEERARKMDESQKTECDSAWDNNLSNAQKKAIAKVDAYLSRHATEDGGNLTFINRILNCTMRERLFIYSCVENDTLESVSQTDILLGQTNYVPSEAAIKKQLLGRSYLVFKKIRWSKLEAAISLLDKEGTREEIKKGHETKEKEGNNDEAADIDENVIADDNLRAQCNELLRIRRQSNNTAAECKEIIDKLKTEELSEDAIKAELIDLRTHLDELSALETQYEETKERFAPEQIAQISEFSGVNANLKLLVTLVSKTKQTQGVADKFDILKKCLGSFISAKKIGNLVTGSATTLLGVLNVIDSVVALNKLEKALDSGDVNKAETIVKMANATTGLLSAGMSTLIGIGTVRFAEELTKGAEMSAKAAEFSEFMNSGLTVMTGAALTADAAELSIQAKHQYHHIKAKGKFNQLAADGRITDIQKHHAQALINLDSHNKRKQARTTIAKTVGDVGTMVGLMMGIPFLSAAAGVGAFALNLGMKGINHIVGKRTVRKTIDEFFDIEENLDQFIGADVREQIHASKGDVRKKLREHMAAELGYASYKGLVNHIIGNYAGFIHKNIFYKPNGEEIFENEKHEYPMSEACVQFAKGLGLRVEFRRNANDRRKTHPSIKSIKKNLAI